jgi:hypothetical protein
MEKGVDYNDLLPVVGWPTVRAGLVMTASLV